MTIPGNVEHLEQLWHGLDRFRRWLGRPIDTLTLEADPYDSGGLDQPGPDYLPLLT